MAAIESASKAAFEASTSDLAGASRLNDGADFELASTGHRR